jgi:hypothetical protein
MLIFFFIIIVAVFSQAAITGKLVNRLIVGEASDQIIENYSIEDSFLNFKIAVLEFTEVEIEFLARQDVNLTNVDPSDIGRVISLNKADLSLDILNLLGIRPIPFFMTFTFGLIDKEDVDPIKMTPQEIEDVSVMEVNDWGICVDFETGLVGFRAALAADQLTESWPHTLFSFYGQIDPFFFELALEAFANKREALGHFSTAVGFEFYLSEDLDFSTGLDVDIGFIKEYNEVFSWGWAGVINYKQGKFHTKACLGATGRFGQELERKITGQILQGLSSAVEVWFIPEAGLGIASVFAVYEEAPCFVANLEVAALLRLGATEFALGYLFVPKAAESEPLAKKLAWSAFLRDDQGKFVGGIFFSSVTSF